MSIINYIESGLNAFDNKKNKMDKAKSKFSRDIGVSEDMADKAEELIDTFDDMDKAYEEHKSIVEDCDKQIQKLSNSISLLQTNLGKATTQQGRNKIQDEIDKKQRQIADQQSRRDVNAKKRDEAESKRDKADRSFLRRFGRNIGKKDVKALGNKMQAMNAISKGGKFGNLAKGLGGLKGGPWMMAVEGLVKAIEFGIGKATEYTKLNAENMIKYLNTTTQVTLNQLKANVASWQDSLSGSYTAQDLAIQSQQAMLESQNTMTLANKKLANTWTNWIPIWGEMNKYEETVMEMEQKLAETRLANAIKVIQQVNEFTKLTDDYLRKQDNAVHQYQAKNGLTTSQTNIFEKRMLTQAETFSKYNKTIEDALKIQNTYTEQSGRNVNFSDTDYEKSMAVGRLVGDDNFAQFSASMNVFNQSVSSSADIMYDMYNYANKMGLSQQKLTKNVMNNLKLANKYDFKGGTKGFIEMAKWAENVRFNLGSLGGMLEKVQGGGLEGSITTAAKLQVLGGNFAMGADPLAMDYEGNADPASFAKRIKSMFGGLGSLDRDSGETTFNYVENRLIRNAAEALGMSTEDAKDLIREDNKKQVVRRQVSNGNLTKDQIDAVANKAQRDSETGEWVVNMLGGGTKAVNALTPDDLKDIVSDNQDEAMEQYAQSTLSSVEKIESATKFVAAFLGGETYLNFIKSAEKSAENMKSAYLENADSVANAIAANREEALKTQLESYSALGSINTQLNDAYKEVHTQKETILKIQKLLDERFGKIIEAKEKTANKNKELNLVYNDAINSNGSYSKGQDLQSARREYWYAKGAEELEAGNWLSGGWNYFSGFSEETLGRLFQGMFNTFNSVYDGTISANGTPMAIAASSVTPIHDGNVKFAKTDPKDSAIFAKTGGPFDKLFNGIFNKISEVYSIVNSNIDNSGNSKIFNHIKTVENSSIMPKAMKYEFPEEANRTVYEKDIGQSVSHKQDGNIGRTPIDINIHGDINLKSDGQTFNISQLIETDPLFIRKVTELILAQIDSSVNGGKRRMWLNRPFIKY